MNIVRRNRRLQIFGLLVEGTSIRSIGRHTDTHRDTIMRHLVDAGTKCKAFLDQKMRNLSPDHWQVDEIWTFCRKKERRLTVEEAEYGCWGDQYLFVAIGEESKLVPTFLVGRRDEDSARHFMKDFAGRLRLQSSVRHRLSTDGFLPYIDAVKAAFNKSVDYGVIVKEFVGKSVFLSRRVVIGSFDKGDICTSHVERNNLTIRTFMHRFIRRTIGFSKKVENLRAAVALHLAYYNFCWLHSSLKKTPAMAAGLTQRPWRLEELLEVAGVLESPPEF